MGMRVGGPGAAWAGQNNSVGNWQQRQQNMKALSSALQGTDLAAAQQAFAAISANNPNAASNNNSPLAKIGQALQAGDLAGAQQAAQAWRGRREGAGNVSTSGAPAMVPNAATSNFLQTLTPLASNSADSAITTTSTATSAQIAQALSAFEKNLFESLRAQDSAPADGSAPAASTASATAPTSTADASATPAAAASTGTPPVGGHHHRHGGGAETAKLGAELGSLIAQTSASVAQNGTAAASADPAATAAAGTTANLDQSFKNLLSTLGVSGNNASLNSFLQAMKSNLATGSAMVSAPTATPTNA